ncbi:Laccase-1 [Camellia lanceoleosa]|uniref:Laccase-1 n=1 Tax=Camellia lanceoleosa TaxID=1840588 RepID=A0ACC0FE08_9ERIC|nr:Laccase-1 [Camellia lanceoleosa]
MKMGGSYALLMAGLLVLVDVLPSHSSSNTKQFHFNVEWKKVTRLCNTKPILTVNGEYPGPTIAVNEGDNVEIKVTNSVDRNTTLHWHGIKQLRTGWADGPAYITQCPIRRGQSYTYKFTVTEQRGTLWWHAHLSWQRASLYGAFIIYPRFPYPISAPIQSEIPIIFGEWWNSDVEAVESDMMIFGGGPDSSDAYTINGMPGPLYPCSIQDTFIQTIDRGKTYMFRIINAAMNNELFFAVANHTLTVIEVDAVYTKPFTTTAIMIAPGQTTNVLLTANQVPNPTGTFVMAARPYVTSVFPFDKTTTIGFLKYNALGSDTIKTAVKPCSFLPQNLPQMNDSDFATKFSNKIRSLASTKYPCNVPKKIDKRVITTISLNLQDCGGNKACKGLYGKKFLASMNNQSFVRPTMSILECHYRNLKTSAYAYNFPEKPPHAFNYTGVNPLTHNMNTEFGTRLLVVPYGTKLEIVLQDTSFLNVENHPIHVHGHNFFVVGTGFGNFDDVKDPGRYNLVDPPERNTVAVPSGGWAAIRINADNPGVWFIHCHLEAHTSWGLATGLVVENGPDPSQRLLPPPEDLPSC